MKNLTDLNTQEIETEFFDKLLKTFFNVEVVVQLTNASARQVNYWSDKGLVRCEKFKSKRQFSGLEILKIFMADMIRDKENLDNAFAEAAYFHKLYFKNGEDKGLYEDSIFRRLGHDRILQDFKRVVCDKLEITTGVVAEAGWADNYRQITSWIQHGFILPEISEEIKIWSCHRLKMEECLISFIIRKLEIPGLKFFNIEKAKEVRRVAQAIIRKIGQDQSRSLPDQTSVTGSSNFYDLVSQISSQETYDPNTIWQGFILSCFASSANIKEKVLRPKSFEIYLDTCLRALVRAELLELNDSIYQFAGIWPRTINLQDDLVCLCAFLMAGIRNIKYGIARLEDIKNHAFEACYDLVRRGKLQQVGQDYRVVLSVSLPIYANYRQNLERQELPISLIQLILQLADAVRFEPVRQNIILREGLYEQTLIHV